MELSSDVKNIYKKILLGHCTAARFTIPMSLNLIRVSKYYSYRFPKSSSVHSPHVMHKQSRSTDYTRAHAHARAFEYIETNTDKRQRIFNKSLGTDPEIK